MSENFTSYVRSGPGYRAYIEPHVGGHLTLRQFRADIVAGRIRAVQIRGQWWFDPADAVRYLGATLRPNTPAAA